MYLVQMSDQATALALLLRQLRRIGYGRNRAHCVRSSRQVLHSLPIPPIVQQYLLPSLRARGDQEIKSASERGSPAAPSLPLKRNRVALALQRKGPELATWCVLASAPDAILRHVASWGDRIPHAAQ